MKLVAQTVNAFWNEDSTYVMIRIAGLNVQLNQTRYACMLQIRSNL